MSHTRPYPRTRRAFWSPALTLPLALVLDARATAAEPAKVSGMAEILAASQPSDWRELDPENTLYLDLVSGRVVIELAPAFAPQHVAVIRKLVRAHYFDGLAILRSQDNFVVQWGDPHNGEPGLERPLPAIDPGPPAEFTRAMSPDLPFDRLPDRDGWAAEVGFSGGMPAARDPKTRQAWLTHCYGTIGVGRDVAADSGLGNELYVVTGQSPRQLDRNIAVVGRVVAGMELLSTIPRGPAPMGFYEDPAEAVPIVSIRVAADLAPSERSKLELLRTDTSTWTALVESRRNRRDEWYKVPAGHIDVCNVPLPTRVGSGS